MTLPPAGTVAPAIEQIHNHLCATVGQPTNNGGTNVGFANESSRDNSIFFVFVTNITLLLIFRRRTPQETTNREQRPICHPHLPMICGFLVDICLALDTVKMYVHSNNGLGFSHMAPIILWYKHYRMFRYRNCVDDLKAKRKRTTFTPSQAMQLERVCLFVSVSYLFLSPDYYM